MQQQLTEHCDSRGVDIRVDRDLGVIRGVKILGLASRNGRAYRPAALKQSATLYEGARVNVDHPARAAAGRSYEDRIGAIRNVSERADGLYGDLFYNPKHRLAEQLAWDADHAPENVGFSHNVLARTSRDGQATMVEEILRVESVDLVADPATTRGLFESEDSDVARLQEENERLQEQIARFERRAAVDARVAEARLPKQLVTDVFLSQCYQSPDDEVLAQLIEARQEDARLLTSTRPQSIEQDRATTHDIMLDAAGFAASIR